MKISLPTTVFFAMAATITSAAEQSTKMEATSIVEDMDSKGGNLRQHRAVHGRRDASVIDPATSNRRELGSPLYLREGYIKVENLAPNKGTCQTPAWVAIHDGTFDTYDRDQPISGPMERLAEDGNNGPIIEDFARAPGGLWDGTVGTAPLCPGEVAYLPFAVSAESGKDYYFSYASMVLPSNDAFISNGNPLAHKIISDGEFVDVDFIVQGRQVLDAGSEVNDEIPENTAFFGQHVPDTGDDEHGVVTLHPGFIPVDKGGKILADPRFAYAHFKADGYDMMRFTVIPDADSCRNYEVRVDCDHPDVIDDPGSHDTVEVIPLEFDGSQYSVVTRKYVSGFCQRNEQNKYVERVHIGTVCGRRVDAVDLVIDGTDAFFIDRVELYEDGHRVKQWSHDGGLGYCISKDPHDFANKGWGAYMSKHSPFNQCVDQIYFEFDRISTGDFHN